MSDWESETHATTTVARNSNGKIRHIKCRAEYFEVKETDEEFDDEYAEGVSARFRFDVVAGETAVLDGVKDIEDDAPTGYETSLDFVRTIPVAVEAIRNVPGIKNVTDIQGHLLDEMDRGATATQ